MLYIIGKIPFNCQVFNSINLTFYGYNLNNIKDFKVFTLLYSVIK